jgi:solute:Na+ symporter, SSS family
MDLLAVSSFVFCTALVAVVTWRIARRRPLANSADGYFLAGRSLTGGYIAGSLLLTNLSTEQLVGLNGAAYQNGICVMAWEVLAAFSLVVMALFFLPRYLAAGITTVPQFLEQRFDRGLRQMTTWLFVIAYTAILLPMILYTGATGLVDVLDLPAATGLERSTLLVVSVWAIGAGGSLYAIFGGLRSVAVSDTLNGFGLLVGGVLITWLGLEHVAGENGTALDGFRILQQAQPTKFDSLGRADQAVPFDTLFTGVLLINLFYWTTNQQIIQRTFGASSLAEGQRGVLIAGLFKLLAPLILVLPGVIAFHLYAERGIQNDQAYGTLVHDVLPRPLVGFFAAVLVGAILSSFNSALNSTATLIGVGLLRRGAGPDADRRLVRGGMVASALVAIAAMIAAPLLEGQASIFDYLQKMNALYFIPLLAVVLVGFTRPRVPAIAAKLALVAGLAAIALGYFVFGVGASPGGLNTFHFLGIVFVALCVGMEIVGRVRPRAEPWQFADGHGRFVALEPWRWAWPVGLALVAAMLALYWVFAGPERG